MKVHSDKKLGSRMECELLPFSGQQSEWASWSRPVSTSNIIWHLGSSLRHVMVGYISCNHTVAMLHIAVEMVQRVKGNVLVFVWWLLLLLLLLARVRWARWWVFRYLRVPLLQRDTLSSPVSSQPVHRPGLVELHHCSIYIYISSMKFYKMAE